MYRLIYTLLLAAFACAQTIAAEPQKETIQKAFQSTDPAQNYAAVKRLRACSPAPRAIRAEADGLHYTLLKKDGVYRESFADTLTTRLAGGFADAPTFSNYLIANGGDRILFEERLNPIYRHSYTANYYLAEGHSLKPLFAGIPDVREASFSPDGQQLLFSSHNNLYLYQIASGKVTPITDDGRWNEIINGTTDWVYEEEFGFTKAYAFSPDGSQIAFLRFDERCVPQFEMMRFDGTLYNKAATFKYPKAGEPNAILQLWIYDIPSNSRRQIDLGKQTDQYIPYIEWTIDGGLCFYRINRHQNHIEVVVDHNGKQRTIYQERSNRYVERPIGRLITFIDADRFIVREETTTGWWHLYLHSIRKGRLQALTQGRFEVTELLHASTDRVWYLATEVSPLRRDLYTIDLNGKHKQRLTAGDGYTTIQPGAGMKYYIETHSNATTPNRITVHKGDGTWVRTLAEGVVDQELMADSMLLKKEFFHFVTERGDTLQAYLIKPIDFDPTKKYPVLLTQYSGPGSQEVRDRWSLDWTDALPYKGYFVACVDVRGTGFRGESFKKQTYGDLGHFEVEDQLSFARYFADKPFIDADRIGIYGWSYGGFMALSCALKGDGLFRMSIAVAPVTSWRYYDSVYTETYNNLPQDNAAGYDANSPLNFPERLSPKTKLLLIHGSADDNVHFQNTMEMARRLNQQGALYDMMVYPDQNHSMMPTAMDHVRTKMIDYTLKTL
ncbi:MAG: DPP IV N-terminal domain-containing protein [Alistipes sp.]